MMRWIGCVMIGGGCLGLGCWYREQFRLRLKALRTLQELLEIMMSEVRYSKATLPECCMKLSRRLEEPYKQALTKVFEEMGRNEGEGFGTIFQKHMKECLERLPLKAEEKNLFLQFAGGFGFEEARMQLSSMEQLKERLDALTKRLESEVAEKSRMAMGLGIMSGLLLVIILL